MRPKQWATLRKLFSFSLPCILSDKILLRLCNKHFLKEIYRNIQSFAFKVLQESNSLKQCKLFSDTKQKHFCWKICKLRKLFSWDLGAYYFYFQRSWDSHNVWGFFERNYIVKREIFLTSFYWLWDFLLQNLKYKNSDDVYWNVKTKGVCPK